MRRIWISVIIGAALLLPALANAHPPAGDPHNSCLQRDAHQWEPTPPVLVKQTLSYLAPLGTSLPCQPGDWIEWGSHSPACPALPWVGPIAGAYCGPGVGPGLTATCTWWPVQNSVPTELVIGFDGRGGPNGRVNLITDGERPAYGTFPPGAWRVVNPYPVGARVIAYPTNIALPPDPLAGVLAPNDLNDIICVTP